MKRLLLTCVLAAALSSSLTGGANGQSNTAPTHERTFANWMFTTPAYNKEALRFVIQEANSVAQELQLPEQLPVTETNILESFITPYPMRRHTRGAVGNVTTSNYIYCVSIDGKFSYLEKTHQDAQRSEWAAEYSTPVSQLDPNTGQQIFETNTAFTLLDTNAAYQLATQWLADVSMDVSGLNQDYPHLVHPTLVWGSRGELRFVPLYWISWSHKYGETSTAYVEVFLPTKTLVQLRVEDSKYILRKPLVFTNLDYLLSQTNASAEMNLPVKQ